MDFIKKIGWFEAGLWKDFLKVYMPYTVAMSFIAIIISVCTIGATLFTAVYSAHHQKAASAYYPCLTEQKQVTDKLPLCPKQ